METNIISKVSQIILEKRLGYKLPKNTPAPVSVSSDDVIQISSTASEASLVARAIENSNDEDRTQKVAAIKEKVQKDKYELSDEMVEKIAENIAELFV